MADLTTIARPYAEAVYRVAADTGAEARWAAFLKAAAAVLERDDVREMLSRPSLPEAGIIDALAEAFGAKPADGELEFLRTLVENRRLTALPDIHRRFEELRAEAAGEVEALIRTALPLNAAQLDGLNTALEKRFGKKVVSRVEEDPALIGGVRVVVGDLNIDLSVRGQLQHMAAALKS